jgi:hypothetical protein
VIATGLSTGVGLDLPPGTYTVTTTYTHPTTGEQLTDTEEKTLP